MADYLDPVPYDAKNFLDNTHVTKFLVLDFDGVFNPEVTSRTFSKDYFNNHRRERIANPDWNPSERLKRREYRVPESYLLSWNDELVEKVNKLCNNDDTVVVWLTTWRENMAAVSELLGFKTKNTPYYLPWGDKDNYYHHYLKAKALSNFVKNVNKDDNAKFVWVDDIAPKDALLNPFDKLSSHHSLTVVPNSWYGLSRNEVDKITSFLSK